MRRSAAAIFGAGLAALAAGMAAPASEPRVMPQAPRIHDPSESGMSRRARLRKRARAAETELRLSRTAERHRAELRREVNELQRVVNRMTGWQRNQWSRWCVAAGKATEAARRRDVTAAQRFTGLVHP